MPVPEKGSVQPVGHTQPNGTWVGYRDRVSGCEWPVDRSCLPELPTVDDPPTGDQQAVYDTAVAGQNSATDIAVSVLWALSGRQFGVCNATARPCPEREAGSRYSDYLYPYLLIRENGHWTNSPCGCVGQCQLGGPRAVHLTGPVVEIEAVTINGVELDPSEYMLEGNILYRVGANWPNQDLNRPLGETGTWSVDFTYGVPVPDGVGVFVGQLAKEFLAACNGGPCRLPRTVVNTTRNGVTHNFDPTLLLNQGKTGLPEIDIWLAAVNPHRLLARPTVR